MSALTPEERAFLEAHMKRRADVAAQQAERDHHERERAAGRRPNETYVEWKRGVAAATSATMRAREHLDLALRPEVDEHRRREAIRVAVAALPWELTEYTKRPQKDFGRLARGRVDAVGAAMREHFARRPTLRDVVRDVDQALAAGVGPKNAMRNPAAFIQQEDLDDLVPDGWGRQWPIEIDRLARRAGVPPLAVPLLNLLTWCSDIRPPEPGTRRKLGSGFQCSSEWLARKLGCSRSWVKVLFNRLDPTAAYRREVAAVKVANQRRRREKLAPLPLPARPTGTPLIQRFRQLKKYSELAKRDGSDGRAWVDRTGVVRQYVDQRGVAYVTEAGRSLLVRRTKRDLAPGERPQVRPNGTLIDLQRRLHVLRALLSSRLRRGASLVGRAVGKAVENSDWKSTAPPSGAPAL